MADRVAIFNEGKVIQVGSPVDVYERPRSRFVADFVGSSNVLPPAFVASHGGTDKWASLRPEKIGVFPTCTPVPADHAHLDGEAKTISYQGAITRVGVEAGETMLTAQVPAEGASFEQGDSVRLIWPQSAMVTMENEA